MSRPVDPWRLEARRVVTDLLCDDIRGNFVSEADAPKIVVAIGALGYSVAQERADEGRAWLSIRDEAQS